MGYERALIQRGEVVVGLDEVGRGSLAGPLGVGAVVGGASLPPSGLTDSQALSARQRESLVAPLHEWARDWALGWASAQEIDEWGLSLALGVAASRAIAGLSLAPSYALVDGPHNFLRASRQLPLGVEIPAMAYGELAHDTLVKGDARCASIAAASVLAKVARDGVMRELHVDYPVYGWDENKGYGTAAHRESIRRHGASIQHRRTWNLA